MKHRTQILLEEWQYQALKEEASLLKVSFSTLIRKGVDRVLLARKAAKKSRGKLASFAGIVKNEKTHLTNQMIDQIVYRKDWK